MTQEVEGDETPVDAIESEVLCQPVVVILLPRIEALDVFYMRGGGKTELVGQITGWQSHLGQLNCAALGSWTIWDL